MWGHVGASAYAFIPLVGRGIRTHSHQRNPRNEFSLSRLEFINSCYYVYQCLQKYRTDSITYIYIVQNNTIYTYIYIYGKRCEKQKQRINKNKKKDGRANVKRYQKRLKQFPGRMTPDNEETVPCSLTG